MKDKDLVEKFAQMGARLRLTGAVRSRGRFNAGQFALDVQADANGELFEIGVRPAAPVAVEVLNIRPKDRHLLLLIEEAGEKYQFLCGHDERHWFVAAIPENAPGVETVKAAMEALKPTEVQQAQA